MQILRVVVLSAAAWSATGCAAAENPEVAEAAAEADRQAIAAAAEAYQQAFLASDPAAAAAVLAQDVVISVPQTPDIRGRAGAQALWVEQFATMDVTDLQVRADELLLDGDIAVDAGEYDETIAITGQAEPLVVNGRYLIVWERQPDGAWRVARFIATDRPVQDGMPAAAVH